MDGQDEAHRWAYESEICERGHRYLPSEWGCPECEKINEDETVSLNHESLEELRHLRHVVQDTTRELIEELRKLRIELERKGINLKIKGREEEST